jgi:hypothetical protein
MCRVEAEVQSIHTLLAGGSFEEAAAAAQSLFSLCLKAGSQVTHSPNRFASSSGATFCSTISEQGGGSKGHVTW